MESAARQQARSSVRGLDVDRIDFAFMGAWGRVQIALGIEILWESWYPELLPKRRTIIRSHSQCSRGSWNSLTRPAQCRIVLAPEPFRTHCMRQVGVAVPGPSAVTVDLPAHHRPTPADPRAISARLCPVLMIRVVLTVCIYPRHPVPTRSPARSTPGWRNRTTGTLTRRHPQATCGVPACPHSPERRHQVRTGAPDGKTRRPRRIEARIRCRPRSDSVAGTTGPVQRTTVTLPGPYRSFGRRPRGVAPPGDPEFR